MREWRGRRMRWSALTHRSIRLASVLYLIDASVFVWRAYHSVPIALVDPDGNPVNALHGFARFLGELKRQFVLCRFVAEALGVKSFASRDYEADDVVGTLATRMRAAGEHVTI